MAMWPCLFRSVAWKRVWNPIRNAFLNDLGLPKGKLDHAPGKLGLVTERLAFAPEGCALAPERLGLALERLGVDPENLPMP